MASPAKHIFLHLHNAIVNIAPERINQFEKEHKKFILEYVDSSIWNCSVDSASNHIKISRMVVELIWCVSYANMTLYMKLIQGRSFDEGERIDLNKDADVSAGMQLMQWAFNNLLFPSKATTWPRNLPKPEAKHALESWENVAKEICLCSMAYIIHHELAHIRLRHQPGFQGTEQEMEADCEAAEWIVGKIGEEDISFTKRILGISVALLVLTIKDIYTGNFGGTTHPRSFDRLYNVLSKFVSQPNHAIYPITSVALTLHLQHRGVNVTQKEYDRFEECLNDYIEKLSTISQQGNTTPP